MLNPLYYILLTATIILAYYIDKLIKNISLNTLLVLSIFYRVLIYQLAIVNTNEIMLLAIMYNN
ncbi:hypothetical protein DRF75_00670 [Ehrlichia minasensis]|uniref:Uncharacterized protein n=1 Tax=Ehrlichia minasensis TaxID=1242993 RepID=A0A4Q6IAV1_9RICK|nr:hypothetical protein DRF75_00670 [Ehrlichia minasensis]